MQNSGKIHFVLSFFRSTILPAIILLIFGIAFFAVTARLWLPGDMLAPAPLGYLH